MAAHTRKGQAALLDDKINILDRKAAAAPPSTQQVFEIVSGILTLVRDKMIADRDSAQLCDYYFDVCEALATVMGGGNTNDVQGTVPVELEDLGRVFGEVARTLRRGANMPRAEYDKGKIEGLKAEIREILCVFNAPSPSRRFHDGVGERTLQPLSIDPRDLITTSASESAVGRLVRREFVPDQLPSLIEAIFTCEDIDNTIRRLPRDDVQVFVDMMDEALDKPDLSLSVRRKCIRPLYRACGRHGVLPNALKIPICYDRSETPLYKGGFADVWKSEYCGRTVAVKEIRIYSTSELQKVIGRFCKEVVTWKMLRHPNILPLTGVTMSNNLFAMISDWMTNGNIREFVEVRPDANRLKLLEDVAIGLIYLHNQGMIHGDLKAANVLIDDAGHARLADFGLLTIISDPTNRSSPSSCARAGSGRWMSPELIDPARFESKPSRPTEYSDCYALGMVVYEVVSGHVPFHKMASPTVLVKVLEGERPPRGMRFTDGLWELLEKCWTTKPHSRPCIDEVLAHLKELSDLPLPLSLGSDPEMGDRSDGDDSMKNLSRIFNKRFDVAVTEGAAASSRPDHPTDLPASNARVTSPNPKTANQDYPTLRTDLSHGDIHQETTKHTNPLDRPHDIVQNLLTAAGVIGVTKMLGLVTQTLGTGNTLSTQCYGATAATKSDHEHSEDSRSHGSIPTSLFTIPQRIYCQGTAIPCDGPLQPIKFEATNGTPFPAYSAFVGRYEFLIDADVPAFVDRNHVINLRIEWPGYDGWGAQIRIVDYREIPRCISLGKLATEIANSCRSLSM